MKCCNDLTNSNHVAGTSEHAPPRDYSLEPKKSARVFSAFTSLSILAAIFGNGILPEIQVPNIPLPKFK